MNSKFIIITEYKHPNKYSISSLIASLEIDPFFDTIPINIFKRKIEKKDIDELLKNDFRVIFIFSLMSYQMKDFVKKFQLFRKYKEKVITIAGGSHPTARPKELLDLGIDYVIVGEGEVTFNLLLKKIISNFNIKNIEGLVFKINDKVILSKNKIDLNKYPICSYRYNLWSPIEISRGCPFACSFCATSSIFGKKYRFRNVNNILKGLQKAVKYGYNKVWFLSSNALAYGSNKLKKPNVNELNNLLRSIKSIEKIKKIFFGTFPSEIRPDYINEEIISVIVEYISNNYFVIGCQHGSNSMLKKLYRGHLKEDVLLAIDILKQYGINVHLDMIFGLPGETLKEEEENIEFLREISQKNVKIHSHYFMPLPSTRLEKSLPKPLSPEMKKIIGRLAKDGYLYGQWYEQTKISTFLATSKDL